MEHNKKIGLYFAAAIFWTFGITAGSLMNMSEVQLPSSNIDNLDKLVHFVFYLVFSVLWFLYLKFKIHNRIKLVVTIFIFSVFFGISIEICQSLFTENREADVKDAIANTFGTLVGVISMLFYNKKIKNN